ncbi:hypothetical protein D9M68_827580 [compost metagenome]
MSTDIERAIAQVKENHERLAHCRKHRFVIPDGFMELDPAQKASATLECAACGGRLPLGHAKAYADGFKAAGGDSEGILPGYEAVDPVGKRKGLTFLEKLSLNRKFGKLGD